MKKLVIGILGIVVVLSALWWWRSRPAGESPRTATPVVAAAVGVPSTPTTVVSSASPEAGSEPPPVTVERPEERLMQGAVTLQTRDVEASVPGRMIRLKLVKKEGEKYPLLRVEETRKGEKVVSRKIAVADHVMVKVQKGVSEEQLLAACAPLVTEIRKRMYSERQYLLRLSKPDLDALPNAVTTLNRLQDVLEYAEPDYMVFATAMPNDPDFYRLYGLHNVGQDFGKGSGKLDADIDAVEAWDLTTGSTNVIVGVIDTGVNYNHPDLAANIWINAGEIPGNGVDDDHNGFIDDVRGWDFSGDDSDPMDGHSHGSHCSGTIGGVGNDGAGIVGVNWQVKILPLKFLNDRGSGYTSDAVDAIHYSSRAVKGVKLTSNSWGGGGYDKSLEDAITEAGRSNQLFICAAGNEGRDTDVEPNYPSCNTNDNLIAVAATDANDALADFSNWGLTTVDLGAPGVTIYSSVLGSNYNYYSGTSMATPHVAGVAALAWSRSLSSPYSVIKQSMLDNADPIPALSGKCVTGGRLNAYRTVANIGFAVSGSVPQSGEIIGTQPTDFVIDFNDPYNTSTVQAADLLVNGLTPNSVALTDEDTLTFHFNSTPVTSEGLQSMSVAEGAVLRASDGKSNFSWNASFRYDADSLMVTSVVPVNGSVVTIPFTNVTFIFNEPFDPASISAKDLIVNQGTVTGFTILDSNTVAFTLSNITTEGVLTFKMSYGALTDVYGNPSLAYYGNNWVDYVNVPFPNLFEAVNPLGSMVYVAKATTAWINSAGDTDSFTLNLDSGQSLSVVVVPTNSLRPTVEIRDPSNVLLASVTAPAAGQEVTAQAVVPATGAYKVIISGADSTSGSYTLQPILNAALEAEAHGGASNDSRATAQSLDAVFATQTNSISRVAVLGVGSNDWYSVTLVSNEVISLAIDILSNGVTHMDFFDASGTKLAGGALVSQNFAEAINSVVIPASGVYYAQVTGGNVGYDLFITRNSAVDIEPNNSTTSAQDITRAGAALGHIVVSTGAFAGEVEPNDDGVPGASLNDFQFAHELSESWLPGGSDFNRETMQFVTRDYHIPRFVANISAGNDADFDFYQFMASPGDTLVVWEEWLTNFDPLVRLYDRNGKMIAYDDDGSGQYGNARLKFQNFPYKGEYYIAADSWGNTAGNYLMSIFMDTDNLLYAPGNDYYRVQANAGDTLHVFTRTPGDGTGDFINNLDPAIEVFGPSGTLVASNYNGAADGHNVSFDYAVTSTGAHSLRLFPTGGTRGEYLVSVTGQTASGAPFQATATAPAHDAHLPYIPTEMTLTFNDNILLPTVQASDLKIDGVNCTSVTVVNGRTLKFTVPVLTEGVRTATVAAAAILDTQGTPLDAFTSVFTIDLTPPRVIESSILPNSTLAEGVVTYTARFDEPMLSGSLEASDVELFGAIRGRVPNASIQYTASNSTLSLVFSNVLEDVYTLTLFSADGKFEDLAGNDLDGEPHWPLPSGNGVPGGNFSVTFYVDVVTNGFSAALTPRSPLGSLVHDGTGRAQIAPAGDVDTFSVILDANQTLTAVVDPIGTTLKPSITVEGPGGMLTNVTATAAGQDAVAQTVAVGSAGTYYVTVGGASNTVGAYYLQLLLNAATETESHNGATNNTLATAQNLNASFVNLGSNVWRGAVLGKGDGVSGDTVGPDGYGYRARAMGIEFEDISTIGDVLMTHTIYDTVASLSATQLNGFVFNFYGQTYSNLYVSDNGLITFDSSTLDPSNTALTNTPTQAAIAPLWDDLIIGGDEGYEGLVYWALRGSVGNRRLILQWNNCKYWQFFAGDFGMITFQVILYEADGSIRFNYLDLSSTNPYGNNEGASATVGIKDAGIQGANRLLASYDAGPNMFVGSGRSVLIGTTVAPSTSDYYSFTASNRVNLVASSPGLTNMDLQLLDSDGNVLATGTGPFSNLTRAIHDYSLPSNGTYYVKVEAFTGQDYVLSIERKAAFDLELNDTFNTALDIPSGAVLGALATTEDSDYYSFLLAAGDTMSAETRTPGDGPYEFANALDPALELYAPNGNLVALDFNSLGDGRNARLSHTAARTGRYRLRVMPSANEGAYIAHVAYATTPLPYVSVVATDASASETGPDAGVFTISRTGSTASPLTVHFTLGGIAVNGVDYNPISSPVVIPAGSTSTTVVVTPINDYANDDNETVVLSIAQEDPYFIATNGTAQIVIADNDNTLVWTGSVDTNWDTTTANWTGDSTLYHEGASVLFKTAGVSLGTTNVYIQPAGVFPNSIVFSNSLTTKPFTFSGGDVGGTASIRKLVTGMAETKVTFKDYTNSLSFRGGTTIEAGTIAFYSGTNGIGTGTRTQGFGSGPITIKDGTFSYRGAALVNGQTNIFPNPFYITMQGAITYGSALGTKAKVIFSGPITFSSNATLQVGQDGTGTTGVDTNGYEFTGKITLNGRNTFNRSGSHGNLPLVLTGDIVDGDSPGFLEIYNAASGADGANRQLFIRGTNNTYSGDTYITGYDQRDNFVTFLGSVDVAANSRLGMGNVKIGGGGILVLRGPNNITPTATLDFSIRDMLTTFSTGTVWIAEGVTNTVSKLVISKTSVAIPLAVYTNGIFTAVNFPHYIHGGGALRVQPALPVVTMAATDASASEFGADPGTFRILRSGDTSNVLSVAVAIGGTAGNGSDYTPLLVSPVVIPAGSACADISVTPVADGVAEGLETISITIQPNAAYTVGAPSNAVVTITDAPYDQWRLEKFGADAGNPAIAGDLADPDHDSIGNLLEYALGLEPLMAGTVGLPVSGRDGDHLTLTYKRRKAPTDVSYMVEVTGTVTGGWTNTGVTEQVLADDGTFETVKATDPATISGNTGRFIRLKVTRL